MDHNPARNSRFEIPFYWEFEIIFAGEEEGR